MRCLLLFVFFSLFTFYSFSQETHQVSVRIDKLTCSLSDDDILDRSDKNDFMIYPNPTKDKVYINSSYETIQVFLIEQNGKIVSEKTLNGKVAEYDLSYLPPGLYYLKIVYGDNVSDVKIIKL